MLDLSKFVEGHLIGVKVCQAEKRACLFLQEATGKNWILTATDVAELMILQMCMQNIIDRISIWDASSNDADYRSKLFSLFHGTFAEEKTDFNLPVINRAVETVRRGGAVLIEVEPVYGALVLILAKEIFLVEE
jgi:hypothetical protein